MTCSRSSFFTWAICGRFCTKAWDVWLEKLAQDEDAAEDYLLVHELDHGLSRAEAKKHLSLVIEAVVENYAEYRDYNATTTQSDRGELLYTLLDFLRVKVGYERIRWNLRPITMAHEVLVRRGLTSAAELWRRAMANRTSDVADQQIGRLTKLQTQYGMRLSSVADRLSETICAAAGDRSGSRAGGAGCRRSAGRRTIGCVCAAWSRRQVNLPTNHRARDSICPIGWRRWKRRWIECAIERRDGMRRMICRWAFRGRGSRGKKFRRN